MCSLAINSPAGLLLRAARSLRVPACCAAVAWGRRLCWGRPGSAGGQAQGAGLLLHLAPLSTC